MDPSVPRSVRGTASLGDDTMRSNRYRSARLRFWGTHVLNGVLKGTLVSHRQGSRSGGGRGTWKAQDDAIVSKTRHVDTISARSVRLHGDRPPRSTATCRLDDPVADRSRWTRTRSRQERVRRTRTCRSWLRGDPVDTDASSVGVTRRYRWFPTSWSSPGAGRARSGESTCVNVCEAP